jgi:hypothetical protein
MFLGHTDKVFVSLANGDLIVYKRDSEGIWDTENPYTRTIGSGAAPINRMLAVAGTYLYPKCQWIDLLHILTSTLVTYLYPECQWIDDIHHVLTSTPQA